MKKLTVMMCVASVLATAGFADLTWSSADLLTAGGLPGISTGSDGWFVQLFQDVNNDTDLSSVSFFSDGTPSGLGSSSDDVLLSSYTDTLVYQNVFSTDTITFSEIFATYMDIYNDNVYTVILDDSSWLAAENTFVLDNTTKLIGSSGEESYTAPNNNPGSHSWTSIAAIPEPSIFALALIGLLTVRAYRRKQI